MKYEITDYRDGDEFQIADLFSKSFEGRIMNVDEWMRKHKTGNVLPCCMTNMWDDSRLIAHVSMFTSRAMYDGKIVVGGIIGTLMARDDYPGTGLVILKWLEKKYEDIVKICFPNENAFPFYINGLKHNYAGDVDFWWKDFRKDYSIIDDKNHNSSQTKYSVVKMDEPSGQFDHELFARKFKYSVLRDKDYLRWRFTNCSSKGYTYFECKKGNNTVGYMVCNTYKETDGSLHGQLLDFAVTDTEAFEYCIREAEKYLISLKVNLIKIWCIYSPFQKYFKRMGYAYGLRPFHCITWKHKLRFDDMYITMADSDIF